MTTATGLLDARLSIAAGVALSPSLSGWPASTCGAGRCGRSAAKQLPNVVMTISVPRGKDTTVDPSHRKALTPFQQWGRYSDQVVPALALPKLEVISSLDTWAQENLLPLLKPVQNSWQPQDFLPDASSEDFLDEVMELRQRAKALPDDYWVCLVGDAITEEALPTYQTWLNNLEGVRDKSGCDPTPWAVWTRGWTAEENRHGDLLNRYLFLSGRVDMRMIERTIQYLIGSGVNVRTDQDPYNGFIYTSFQERATFISHGNTARHAKEHGEHRLAKICGFIASDEKRHEIAYSRIVGKLFELDPSGAMLSFQEMMKKKITMPAHLMYDGQNPNLFNDYSSVAQRCGVYTAQDYVSVMEHLISYWQIENLKGLSPEAQNAQDYVCRLPSRLHRLASRAADTDSSSNNNNNKANQPPPCMKAFSWIHNKEVALM